MKKFIFTGKINRHAIHVPSVILFTPPIYIHMLEVLDSEGVIVRSSDVKLLFNQERLQNELGIENLTKIIDSFKSQKITDQFSEIRKNISDDSLCDFIKSRHFQNPSELKSWAKYLLNNYESEYDEFMKKKEEQVKKHEEEVRKLRDKELEEYLKRKNS